MSVTGFELKSVRGVQLLRLVSDDGTNRLTGDCVISLTKKISELARERAPLIIAGNERFFSAGAELQEITELTGQATSEFSKMGQELTARIEGFPAPVFAAISGYCMGGGLDLALACRRRVASPNAVFGHRGAALGLITGWGGTQRLPRLIGKARALALFVAAEKLTAKEALQLGLINCIADNPVAEAIGLIHAP
jgi:enoyl-CoA hydratase